MRSRQLRRNPEGALVEVESSGTSPQPAPKAQARLQRAVGNQGLQEALGEAQALDSGTRARFEAALGRPLPEVSIHTGPEAAAAADERGLAAFALGDSLAFNHGAYRPGTLAGDALLAHELAHVQQQEGATGDVISATGSAHEADANRSALGLLLRLWSGVKDGATTLRANLGPALRSGLALQGCEQTEADKLPAGASSLSQAEAQFVDSNAGLFGDLTLDEGYRASKALQTVAGDNEPLMLAFYDYYTRHEINKFSGSDLEKARKDEAYATTLPMSDTYVDPNILDPAFAPGKLGSLLIHEFVHPRHVGMNWAAAYQEGEAYAIEDFFARRSGVEDRVQEIEKIVAGYHTPGDDNFETKAAWRAQYYKARARIDLLYRRIDGKPLPADAPASLQALTPEEAKRLVAEYITTKAEDRSATLKELDRWVDAWVEKKLGLPVP